MTEAQQTQESAENRESGGPLAAYRARVRDGALAADPAQAATAERLQALWSNLRGYDPQPGVERGRAGLLGRFIRRKPADGAGGRPRGLYLVGDVGRGKSMLMDLFFAEADVRRKRRIHFHRFMQDAHARMHAWKRAHPDGRDPIPPLADTVAAEAALLCFDEFQVNDIADAMILGRLFEAMFARGVVVVATSNRAPEALYADGINRGLFLPFIALIRARMEVVQVAGGRDFRLDRLRGAQVWFAPILPASEDRFDALWASMLDGAAETGGAIEVAGRRTTFPRAAGGQVRAHFASLCGQALGPGDYLAFARRFHTVFLEAVPTLGPEKRNEAARFVTLVDALYEARAKLVVLAAAEPQALYPAGDGAFEFQRTASRLEEMRSADWIERASRA